LKLNMCNITFFVNAEILPTKNFIHKSIEGFGIFLASQDVSKVFNFNYHFRILDRKLHDKCLTTNLVHTPFDIAEKAHF